VSAGERGAAAGKADLGQSSGGGGVESSSDPSELGHQQFSEASRKPWLLVGSVSLAGAVAAG